MLSSTEIPKNTEDKIQILLNLGYFDSHLSELSKSLYTKGVFSNELRCYISDKNIPYLIKSFSQRNKIYIEEEKKRKKVKNSINLYDLNKNKQAEFNLGMLQTLKSLNNFKEEINSKFKELKEENHHFVESFDAYKGINKKKHDIKDNNILLDLSSNYKPKKNISFDLKSLNSDVLKESPLSTKKLDKLRFYYILNRKRNKKEGNKNNMVQKEPVVWNQEEMNDLKEIKYLKKVNKITQNKLMKIKIVNNPNNINEENELGLGPNNKLIKYDKNKFKSLYDYLKYKENLIKSKEEKERLNLEIEKDKKEIDKLKMVIKETIGKKNKYKKLASLKLYNPNYGPEKKSNNLSDIKEQTFSINRYHKAIPELTNNKMFFNSTMNKDSLLKSSSFSNLKAFYESQTKNFSMYSKDSASNIFQQSTYYSNSLNNKTILNKINFNNLSNIQKSSRKINKNKTSIMDKTKFNFSFNRIPLSEKFKNRKSVHHNLDIKYKSYLDDPQKNSTDNIYSICKKMENKKYTRNKKEYINMINNYIKSRKNNSSKINKEMDLKETFSFFHNIKNKIKNEDIKISFRNLKMMEKSEGKKQLKYIDILDSNLVNKESELLFKILKKK